MALNRQGGPCFWYYGNSTTIPPETNSCDTTPFTPDDCNFVQGSLTLVFDSSNNIDQVGPITIPTFASALRLDRIARLSQDLNVFTRTYADKLDNTAVLFQELRSIGGIVTIQDSAGNLLQDIPQAFPQLQVVYALIVDGTGFIDMSSFPALSCIAAFFNVLNNQQLSSLAGFNAAGFPPALTRVGGNDCSATVLTFDNNPSLVGPGELDPLRPGFCDAPDWDVNSCLSQGLITDDFSVSVATANCNNAIVATTRAGLCAFILNGYQCPPIP